MALLNLSATAVRDSLKSVRGSPNMKREVHCRRKGTANKVDTAPINSFRAGHCLTRSRLPNQRRFVARRVGGYGLQGVGRGRRGSLIAVGKKRLFYAFSYISLQNELNVYI